MWGFSLPLNGLCPLLSSCLFFFFFDCTCSSSSFVTLLYSSFPSWSHCPLLLLLALCCLILSPVFCPLHCMCCCSLLFFLCILLSSFVSSCLFYSVSGLPSTSCFHCYTTTTATFFVLFIFIPPFVCYISPLSFASSFTSEYFTSHTDTGLPLRPD